MKVLIQLRALIFTAIIMVIVILPFFAEGSQIRVDSLGFSGLVPDEEIDLRNNPAYLNFIIGNRIYTGISYSYYSIKDYFGSDKRYRVTPYAELVKSIAGKNFYFNYLPDYLYEHESRYSDCVGKIKNLSNFSIGIGHLLGEGLKFGASVAKSRNSINTRYDSEKREQNSLDQIITANLGLIYDFDENRRIGAVLSNSFKDNEFSDLEESSDGNSSMKTVNYGYLNYTSLKILPEFSLPEGYLLKMIFSINYNKSNEQTRKMIFEDNGLNYTSTVYDTYKEVSSTEGIGILKEIRGTLWAVNLLANDVYYNKLVSEGESYGSVDEIRSHSIAGTVGIEKEILKDLLLRARVTILDWNYSRSWTDHPNNVRKSSEISIPLNARLSLGYQFSENLLIDIAFYQLYDNKISYRSEQSFYVNTDLSYKF